MTPQKTAAALLGLTARRLAQLARELGLVEGPDIAMGEDGRTICFTEEGMLKLQEAVGAAGAVESGDHPPEPEKPAVAEPVRGAGHPEETLTVSSVPRLFPDGSIRHVANPRIVMCRRSSGETVSVRVPDCRHFTAQTRDGTPMTLKARFEGDPPHWYLLGRCPRWLGRY